MNNAEDEIPLPSVGILSEEESSRQLRAMFEKPQREEIERLKQECNLAGMKVRQELLPKILNLAAHIAVKNHALETMLASASPHPIEHEVMYKAWEVGKMALANSLSVTRKFLDEKALIWWTENIHKFNCGKNEQGYWIQHKESGPIVAQRCNSMCAAISAAMTTAK